MTKKKVKKTTKTSQKNNLSRVERNYKKKKKIKIRFGRILLVFLVLFFILYLFSKIFSFPIKNIYVIGNTLFSDQEIIEMSSLENYPSYFSFTKSQLEKKLEKNTYILNATIKKKRFKEIYIEILENRPLFYDTSKEKTVLKDKTLVDTKFETPILLNYIPDTLYDKFIEKVSNIDLDIINRISEIKYDPNEVDEERFLFMMNDGNYVYITLSKMEKINNYIAIMREVLAKYDEENGILYLDEGEYFKVF